MKINIQKYRKQKKLSRLQLSKKSGVARGYISELEAGKYENPSIKVV